MEIKAFSFNFLPSTIEMLYVVILLGECDDMQCGYLIEIEWQI